MPAGFLLAAAVSGSFICQSPTHHDGDNVRCANIGESIRLQGIDAPEMPGACRPGRACTPGDPYAARDTLRALSGGQDLNCTAEDIDVYGRIIARCRAGKRDLSCAMIASGMAVPRYVAIDCSGQPPLPDVLGPAIDSDAPPPRPPMPAPVFAPADAPTVTPGGTRPLPEFGPWGWVVLAWFILINIATWARFATDKANARTSRFLRRVPEASLLGMAALGGSPAAWLAVRWLRHKSSKPRFLNPLLILTGLQMGCGLGLILWWLL